MSKIGFKILNWMYTKMGGPMGMADLRRTTYR